jgi:hypothetical protein
LEFGLIGFFNSSILKHFQIQEIQVPGIQLQGIRGRGNILIAFSTNQVFYLCLDENESDMNLIGETMEEITDVVITNKNVYILTVKGLYTPKNGILELVSSSDPESTSKYGSLKLVSLSGLENGSLSYFFNSIIICSNTGTNFIVDFFPFMRLAKVIVSLCEAGGVGEKKNDDYSLSHSIAQAQPTLQSASDYFVELHVSNGQGQKGQFSDSARLGFKILAGALSKLVDINCGHFSFGSLLSFPIEQVFGILRCGGGCGMHPDIITFSRRIATLNAVASSRFSIHINNFQYQEAETKIMGGTYTLKKEKREFSKEELKQLYLFASLQRKNKELDPTHWGKKQKTSE